LLADEITPGTNHTAAKVGHGAGYALRFPRIVSFRNAEKRPEDATIVKEIVEMFQQQGAPQRSRPSHRVTRASPPTSYGF